LQRELDALPDAIAGLEAKLADLRAAVNEPAFYQRPHGDVQRLLEELRDTERELEAAVDRWGELEQQAAAAAEQTT
jgi:ATP-binding cassette subfamily F protein uup